MSKNKRPLKINHGASSLSGMGAGRVIGTEGSKTDLVSCDMLFSLGFRVPVEVYSFKKEGLTAILTPRCANRLQWRDRTGISPGFFLSQISSK
jgi:hypothetical protein